MPYHTDFSLISPKGQRKYLNQEERLRFYSCSKFLPMERMLFCQVLYYTGARLSEIVHLKTKQIDFDERIVNIQTLKRRRKNLYRQIPLPDHVLNGLQTLVDYRDNMSLNLKGHMWSFSLSTATRIIKRTMLMASIEEPRNCALGLRHGYAAFAAELVPVTQVQKWMGHADLRTTDIYLQISGREERVLAERLWVEESN